MVLESDLSHMGSALAHVVLADNIPLASFLLADAGVCHGLGKVDNNEPISLSRLL